MVGVSGLKTHGCPDQALWSRWFLWASSPGKNLLFPACIWMTFQTQGPKCSRSLSPPLFQPLCLFGFSFFSPPPPLYLFLSPKILKETSLIFMAPNRAAVCLGAHCRPGIFLSIVVLSEGLLIFMGVNKEHPSILGHCSKVYILRKTQ